MRHLPPKTGDRFDPVIDAIAACYAAVDAYEADRWNWLPWRDAKHNRRIRAARDELRLQRRIAGMRLL